MDLQIAPFQADATPPLGAPLCHGNVVPAQRIVQPLEARGLVLLPRNAAPVVLCAVDWVGISNKSFDCWRTDLAEAAGTEPGRVSVHTLHPHDAPGTDLSTEAILAENGLDGDMFDPAAERATLDRTCASIRTALPKARPVTHLSLGKAKVNAFASNRRLLGPDGTVQFVRYSHCPSAEVRAMDEGVVDPFVRLVGFWHDDEPTAVLSYYASHPQSFYGRGAVSPDTVGLARGLRDAALPSALHVHFCGAGGNVAAGKYNDGSPSNRFVLAERLARGMEKAWKEATKLEAATCEFGWNVLAVALPLSDRLKAGDDAFETILTDTGRSTRERLRAARDLAFARRQRAGHQTDISCLQLGPARILHMPAELFVEYQLAAQAMRPDDRVCMAAYGDDGATYIGTTAAYTQGGYECGPNMAKVSPEVEGVLMDAMRRLLA